MSKMILVNSASNLLDFVLKSPIFKTEKSVSVISKKNNKGIETIDNVIDSRKFSKDDTVELENINLSSINKNDKSSETGLISVSNKKNDLLVEQNQLLRKQIESNNIRNEIMANNSKLKYEVNSSLVLVLDGLANEVKRFNEFNQAVQLLSVSKLNFDMFGLTDDGTVLKNTSNEDIIPIYEKAKYHSEKRIDEEKANKIDHSKIFDDSLDDGDIDINIMNDMLKNIFTYDEKLITENMKEGK